MNRLLKYFGSRRRKVAIQKIAGQPDICTFCAQSLEGSHINAASQLNNADGTGPAAVICSRCIDQLAGLSKLTGWFQRDFRDEPDCWPLLESLLRKRVVGETGTKAMREAVVALLMRLMKRACGIISGQRRNGLTVCQKTGVSLAQPRIAIVTGDQNAFMFALYAGADVIGLPILPTTEFEASNGEAYQELKRTKCNGDSVIAENGILVVADEFPTVADDVGVIYLIEDDTFGVPNGIEVIKT